MWYRCIRVVWPIAGVINVPRNRIVEMNSPGLRAGELVVYIQFMLMTSCLLIIEGVLSELELQIRRSLLRTVAWVR